MAVSEQVSALIATFADRSHAERFVRELKRAGFKEDEIGVLIPHQEGENSEVEEDALIGAVSGGMVGAVAGAVATGLIPGIGPVVATGLLAGVLGGAVAGVAAGGVIGALVGMGVPEERAREYEEEFLKGRSLVVVQAVGRGGDALAILHRCEESWKDKKKT